MMDIRRINLLTVVLDVNPVWWGQFLKKNPEVSFTRFIDNLIVACNSFLMLNSHNKLCLIVSHGAKNHFVYPRYYQEESSESTLLEKREFDGKCMLLGELDEIVREEIKELVLNDNSGELYPDCVLTGALSMALCYINRIQKEVTSAERVSSRLLVLKGSKDNPLQYMDFMSITFASQKMGVIMDACILDNDSNFLKQACDILDGIYLKLPHISGFLEYLMYLYMADDFSRSSLSLPPRLSIGHKAACFCHRTLVDVGYVCSVCLSIFCNFNPICSTCHSTVRVNLHQKPTRKKLRK